MRRVLLILLVCCITSGVRAQVYDFSRVDAMLQDSLAVLGGTSADAFGGLTVLLWKDGKLIYDHSLALPGKNMSKTRLMPIASSSKWVSGSVICALLDDGVLRLDDSVAQYIPTATGDMRRMTIRQLFSFTSGLRPNVGPITPCVEDLQSSATLAECVDSILAGKLFSQPGNALNYGSESMHVAGRMAEIASGLKIASGSCWDTLFQRTIARPMGLLRTSWDIKGLFDTDNPRIDGGVYSTAEEYLVLTRMILDRGIMNGKRILSEDVIDSMISDQTRGARIVYTPYLGMESNFPGIKNTRYGIGVWRERIDSATGRALEVASQGRFGFSPWVDFERGYCGVLAIKSNDVVSIYPSYMKLKQLIREALDATTSADEHTESRAWDIVGFYDVLGRSIAPDASGPMFIVERSGSEIRTRVQIR